MVQFFANKIYHLPSGAPYMPKEKCIDFLTYQEVSVKLAFLRFLLRVSFLVGQSLGDFLNGTFGEGLKSFNFKNSKTPKNIFFTTILYFSLQVWRYGEKKTHGNYAFNFSITLFDIV